MAINEDLIKVQKGDEVKIEKEGNKYYVKTLEGESLSGQNTSGFTGKRNARRFVFSSEDAAESFVNIKGYYKEGEKPEPVAEVKAEPKAEPTGDFGGELGGAKKEAEKTLSEVDTDLTDTSEAPKDLAEAEAKSAEAAKAASEALGEVTSAATSAFGGDTVGDVEQDTSSFTDELATAASVAQPSGGGGAAPSPAPVTVATGSAAGGAQEAAAAKSVGPAEDEAVEYYTRGRRASILTGPQGLLGGDEVEEEDRSLRRRRSLLAG